MSFAIVSGSDRVPHLQHWLSQRKHRLDRGIILCPVESIHVFTPFVQKDRIYQDIQALEEIICHQRNSRKRLPAFVIIFIADKASASLPPVEALLGLPQISELVYDCKQLDINFLLSVPTGTFIVESIRQAQTHLSQT